MRWKRDPGIPNVQAPLSHGHGVSPPHDYVISHRLNQHTVSYRPPGHHEHVGTYETEKEAKAAAAAHARGDRQGRVIVQGPAAKRSSAQIEREIAEALATKPQHARKKKPDEYQLERDRLLRALDYAGNTEEQVRRLHEMIAALDAKHRGSHATVRKATKGRFWIAAASDPRDRYAAGYDGNSFATAREARAAIKSLQRLGGEWDVPWVVNED